MGDLKKSIKNYLQKIPAFISGMIVGILITGAFFLFKINEYLLQMKDTIYPKITVIEKNTESSSLPVKVKVKKYKSLSSDTNFRQTKEDTNSTDVQKENVSVLEERVISEKDIKIIPVENNLSDTALAALAEIPHYMKEGTIHIVFKRTPFNNKGYHFENNQLVLYGLGDIPYINLYEYKGELYLKYEKAVFKLPYTEHFQALVKVEDEQLLAKMN